MQRTQLKDKILHVLSLHTHVVTEICSNVQLQYVTFGYKITVSSPTCFYTCFRVRLLLSCAGS